MRLPDTRMLLPMVKRSLLYLLVDNISDFRSRASWEAQRSWFGISSHPRIRLHLQRISLRKTITPLRPINIVTGLIRPYSYCKGIAKREPISNFSLGGRGNIGHHSSFGNNGRQWCADVWGSDLWIGGSMRCEGVKNNIWPESHFETTITIDDIWLLKWFIYQYWVSTFDLTVYR